MQATIFTERNVLVYPAANWLNMSRLLTNSRKKAGSVMCRMCDGGRLQVYIPVLGSVGYLLALLSFCRLLPVVHLAARNEDRMYEIYAFGQGLFHCMTMLRLCKQHAPCSWFPIRAGLYRIHIIWKRWERLYRMDKDKASKQLPAFSAETLAMFREESTRASKMCRCLHNGLMGECS